MGTVVHAVVNFIPLHARLGTEAARPRALNVCFVFQTITFMSDEQNLTGV